MSDSEAVQGLTCPKCGGVIAIPEGQEIVQCPYCDLRSVVKGERGLRHYQVPCRIDRKQASAAFQQFLHSNMAIAMDAARSAQLSEAFVAYLPFWAAWGRALGWVFGEKQVGSGDHKRYEPREVRFAEEMSWNGAACDVGEFGVNQVPLTDQQIQPFQVEALHSTGMVFEPVGSQTDAKSSAEAAFQNRIRQMTNLDRVSQQFVRIVRQRLGMVYYPLWILRYLYRGRAFQVASVTIASGAARSNARFTSAFTMGPTRPAFLSTPSDQPRPSHSPIQFFPLTRYLAMSWVR